MNNQELTSFSRTKKAMRSLASIIEYAGYAASMFVMIWLYTIHIASVKEYPYFSPSSNVEEIASTYSIAANFNRFGFLYTGFLQNKAASPDPADHPFVYSHMPPGVEVVNALLMRATNGSFYWTAIVLATLVPFGFAFYLFFIQKILKRHTIGGGESSHYFSRIGCFIFPTSRIPG